MSALIKRTATGFLIVLVIIGAIALNSLSFVALFFLVMLGTLYEFYNNLLRAKIHPQIVYGLMIASMFYIFAFLNAIGFIPIRFIFLFFPLVSVIFLAELFLRENRPFHNIAFTLLGLFYIALPFSLFHYFVFHPSEELILKSGGEADIVNFVFQPGFKVNYYYQILLGFFFLNWLNDTGAYLIGVPFGKHKLFKRISPKKSWEGFFGGAMFSIATAILLARFFPVLQVHDWLVIAFIVIVFATFGDLVESMLKRYLGLKDSGSILPGHGGLLDRFDGVIFSAPIVYAYLNMIF